MHKRFYWLPFFAAQAGIVLAIAVLSLRLYSYDLSVPFNYSGDSVVILMYIKGLIQDGWPSTISQLSAPFSYPGAAFPILTSVDWVFIKAISAFTNEPGYLLNAFWLLTLVMSAWAAAYGAFQLGLSRGFAFGSGIIYAFLPYALIRNVAHLNLVYYIVPLLCLLAIAIASRGQGLRNRRQVVIVGLVACILQGFDYVYYSYFAVILFCVAALASYERSAGIRQLKLPAMAILAIVISTMLNFFPTVHSWKWNGFPPEMTYKSTAEAEIYGAKIRRMVAPHPDNFFRPLGKVGEKELTAKLPNENENVTARLGLYGAFGLLAILVFILRRGVSVAQSQPRVAVAVLGMATLLIITVGGLGSIINLITVPDIRAYNRFSVFLSFLAIIFLGLILQDIIANYDGRRRLGSCFLVGALIAFSLYDQLLDSKSLRSTQENDLRRAKDEKGVVDRLEELIPEGGRVLQLPFTGFPPLARFHKMDSYDHVRPYLWSHNLSWSWPSFSQRHRAWQSRMSLLRGEEFIKASIFSGFNIIWIDRFAYEDNGDALILELTQGGGRHVDVGSSRVAVLDLRQPAIEIRGAASSADIKRYTESLLGPEVLVDWGVGFYAEEWSPEGKAFHWAQSQAQLSFRNVASEAAELCIAFELATPAKGVVRLDIGNDTTAVKTESSPTVVSIPLTMQSGESKAIRFSTDLPKLNVTGDARNLHMYIKNLIIKSGVTSNRCRAN